VREEILNAPTPTEEEDEEERDERILREFEEERRRPFDPTDYGQPTLDVEVPMPPTPPTTPLTSIVPTPPTSPSDASPVSLMSQPESGSWVADESEVEPASIAEKVRSVESASSAGGSRMRSVESASSAGGRRKRFKSNAYVTVIDLTGMTAGIDSRARWRRGALQLRRDVVVQTIAIVD